MCFLTVLNLKTIENTEYWWPGYHCSYSDFLRAGWFRDWILIEARFPCPSTLALRPTKSPVQWALGLAWTYSAQGVVLITHPSLASRLRMRWELYLCACTGKSWGELYLYRAPVSFQSVLKYLFQLCECNADTDWNLQLCTNCWYFTINATPKVLYTYDTNIIQSSNLVRHEHWLWRVFTGQGLLQHTCL